MCRKKWNDQHTLLEKRYTANLNKNKNLKRNLCLDKTLQSQKITQQADIVEMTKEILEMSKLNK